VGSFTLVSSTNNDSYYIFFVDAYLIFTWVILLKCKLDALLVIQQLQSMVELQFDTNIKAVQTNCSGKFCPSHDYLTSHGINHRTIFLVHVIRMAPLKGNIDLSATLLQQASLTMTCWGLPFLTTMYLISKIPSASVNFGLP